LFIRANFSGILSKEGMEPKICFVGTPNDAESQNLRHINSKDFTDLLFPKGKKPRRYKAGKKFEEVLKQLEK